jgi:hypothetical protein
VFIIKALRVSIKRNLTLGRDMMPGNLVAPLRFRCLLR